MTDKPKRRCLGYGEAEGCCTATAGTPWTPYWCPSCDELRRATITAQLEGLLADMEKRKVTR